jgi:hypothetical protein
MTQTDILYLAHRMAQRDATDSQLLADKAPHMPSYQLNAFKAWEVAEAVKALYHAALAAERAIV